MKLRNAILIGPMLHSTRELHALLTRARKVGSGSGAFVVAVDHGLDWALQARVPVDLAVGDWDSLRDRQALSRISHLTLPGDKDRSDLYYALLAAANSGAERIVCIGFSGGQPDHQIAVLLDLSDQAVPVEKRLLGSDAEWIFISPESGPWKARLKKGTRVSIFAMGGTASAVEAHGFVFPLHGEELPPSSRGLSNRIASAACSVRIGRGSAMIIVPAEPRHRASVRKDDRRHAFAR